MSNILTIRMMQAADSSQVAGLSRFFKTGKGQYGEGDRFLGIKVPVTRGIVKECWSGMSFGDLEECISSEYHEIRLAALLCIVRIFKSAKKDAELQKKCIDFYLSHTRFINNWDLVDLSCYELLGTWLLDKDGPMHDLLQKATGWMLREAGKRDPGRLVGYLRKNWDRMPATMRRYACEKLPEDTVKSLRLNMKSGIACKLCRIITIDVIQVNHKS